MAVYPTGPGRPSPYLNANQLPSNAVAYTPSHRWQGARWTHPRVTQQQFEAILWGDRQAREEGYSYCGYPELGSHDRPLIGKYILDLYNSLLQARAVNAQLTGELHEARGGAAETTLATGPGERGWSDANGAGVLDPRAVPDAHQSDYAYDPELVQQVELQTLLQRFETASRADAEADALELRRTLKDMQGLMGQLRGELSACQARSAELERELSAMASGSSKAGSHTDHEAGARADLRARLQAQYDELLAAQNGVLAETRALRRELAGSRRSERDGHASERHRSRRLRERSEAVGRDLGTLAARARSHQGQVDRALVQAARDRWANGQAFRHLVAWEQNHAALLAQANSRLERFEQALADGFESVDDRFDEIRSGQRQLGRNQRSHHDATLAAISREGDWLAHNDDANTKKVIRAVRDLRSLGEKHRDEWKREAAALSRGQRQASRRVKTATREAAEANREAAEANQTLADLQARMPEDIRRGVEEGMRRARRLHPGSEAAWDIAAQLVWSTVATGFLTPLRYPKAPYSQQLLGNVVGFFLTASMLAVVVSSKGLAEAGHRGASTVAKWLPWAVVGTALLLNPDTTTIVTTLVMFSPLTRKFVSWFSDGVDRLCCGAGENEVAAYDEGDSYDDGTAGYSTRSSSSRGRRRRGGRARGASPLYSVQTLSATSGGSGDSGTDSNGYRRSASGSSSRRLPFATGASSVFSLSVGSSDEVSSRSRHRSRRRPVRHGRRRSYSAGSASYGTEASSRLSARSTSDSYTYYSEQQSSASSASSRAFYAVDGTHILYRREDDDQQEPRPSCWSRLGARLFRPRNIAAAAANTVLSFGVWYGANHVLRKLVNFDLLQSTWSLPRKPGEPTSLHGCSNLPFEGRCAHEPTVEPPKAWPQATDPATHEARVVPGHQDCGGGTLFEGRSRFVGAESKAEVYDRMCLAGADGGELTSTATQHDLGADLGGPPMQGPLGAAQARYMRDASSPAQEASRAGQGARVLELMHEGAYPEPRVARGGLVGAGRRAHLAGVRGSDAWPLYRNHPESLGKAARATGCAQVPSEPGYLACDEQLGALYKNAHTVRGLAQDPPWALVTDGPGAVNATMAELVGSGGARLDGVSLVTPQAYAETLRRLSSQTTQAFYAAVGGTVPEVLRPVLQTPVGSAVQLSLQGLARVVRDAGLDRVFETVPGAGGERFDASAFASATGAGAAQVARHAFGWLAAMVNGVGHGWRPPLAEGAPLMARWDAFVVRQLGFVAEVGVRGQVATFLAELRPFVEQFTRNTEGIRAPLRG